MNWKTQGGWIAAGLMAVVAAFFAGAYYNSPKSLPQSLRDRLPQLTSDNSQLQAAREAAEVAELKQVSTRQPLNTAAFEPLPQ